MNIHHHLFIIIIQMLLSSNIFVKSEKQKIKILAVGNSIAQDSYSYVPFISLIKENFDLTIGVAYISSASFITHLNNFFEKKYSYHKINPNENKWTTLTNYSLEQIIQDEDWTHVTFQQASGSSFDYSSHSDLKELLIKVKSKLKTNPKFGWLFIPVRPEKYVLSINTYSETELEKYYILLVSTIKKIMDEYNFDFIFPVGTAIRNALNKKSGIDKLKDENNLDVNMDNNDNKHMRNGLPKLIESYTIAEQLLRMFKIKSSISNDKIEIDFNASTEWKCPGNRKFAGPVNDVNRVIAQKCAIAAVDDPYEKNIIE